MTTSPSRPTPGRPRSARSRAAVLESSRVLLARDGLERLTIEGIAAEAGVSKATIYRWWPSKAAVALEAAAEKVAEGITFTDSGDIRSDLVAEIRSVIELYTATDTGAAVLDLIVASRSDVALAEDMREQFFGYRRQVAVDYLVAARERGSLRADLDPDLVIDAIWGALYYRLLVAHLPLTPDYAQRLVDHFWPALAPDPPTPADRD